DARGTETVYVWAPVGPETNDSVAAAAPLASRTILRSVEPSVIVADPFGSPPARLKLKKTVSPAVIADGPAIMMEAPGGPGGPAGPTGPWSPLSPFRPFGPTAPMVTSNGGDGIMIVEPAICVAPTRL